LLAKQQSTGSGNYIEGEQVTVKASPSSNYEFISWEENGNVLSTNEEYTFEIEEDRDLIANFQTKAHRNIEAGIGEELLDKIDYYLEKKDDQGNYKFFDKGWDIEKDQYIAWIATIIWGESGEFGYVAHSSQAIGSDRFDHKNENPSEDHYFHFSSGIGPFQKDRGVNHQWWPTHEDRFADWGNWPTIKKLDFETALKSTLYYHMDYFGGETDLDMNDIQQKIKKTWYAVSEDPSEGHRDTYWKDVTGEEWEHANESDRYNWDHIKGALAANARDYLGYEWSTVRDAPLHISPRDYIYWDLGLNENEDGIDLKFEGSTKEDDVTWESYYINVYSHTGPRGGYNFDYYYANCEEQGKEVWVWDDPERDFKDIFIRDYTKGWNNAPWAPIEESREGMTLDDPALKLPHEVSEVQEKIEQKDHSFVFQDVGSGAPGESFGIRGQVLNYN